MNIKSETTTRGRSPFYMKVEYPNSFRIKVPSESNVLEALLSYTWRHNPKGIAEKRVVVKSPCTGSKLKKTGL
jgi:hypothetical protein